MAIDLRSDTVTRPTRAMREAMFEAPVGDDVFGEDPTVRALEERVAALLGKPEALFVPSGVMANQIALAIQTQPGDQVLVPVGAHCLHFESGAAAALAGLTLTEVGTSDGRITPEALVAAVAPDNAHYPRTRLVTFELTHNRSGGRVAPAPLVAATVEAARGRGLHAHLDGARLWNAAAATGLEPHQLAAPFDTVAVCLSKGLGAPVGSLLAGDAARLSLARRRRKLLGGGMRQAGILAAAGLHALDHHRERLVEDHRRARRLAEALSRAPGVLIDPAAVETNLVLWELSPSVPVDAAGLLAQARTQGVLLTQMGPRLCRAVTHLDVNDEQVDEAGRRLVSLFERLAAG